ncbi:MAG: PilZ domain-containing protein [Desulfurivibrio sp.]|nr:MAG: PilZ domain-containing protein [Desulfurivibrio sp.]
MGTEPDEAKQERRKHERFPMKNSVFAMLDSHLLGHAAAVLDVSKGGAALQYCSSEGCNGNWKRLDVISATDNFFLRKLPIEIISDQLIADEQGKQPEGGIKRCGVKFVSVHRAVAGKDKWGTESFGAA